MIKSAPSYLLSYRSLFFYAGFLVSTAYVNAEPKHYNHEESQKGIAPIANKWVLSKPKDKSTPSTLSEQDIKDPQKLLAFLKNSPDALDPSRMSPFIAIEVGKTLLYGGEVRKAVQLLNAAKVKWPRDLSILQSWAQALIKSGQPSYVRKGIETWQNTAVDNNLDSYTQYLYALSIYLEGPKEAMHLKKAASLIDQLLQSDPNYIGPDGITADRLESFKAELLGRLSQQR